MKTFIVLACFWIAGVGALQSPNDKGTTKQNGASSAHSPADPKGNKTSPGNPLPNGVVVNCNQGSGCAAESECHTQEAAQPNEDLEIQRKIAEFTKYLVAVGALQFLALGGTLVIVGLQAAIMRTHAMHLEKVASAALLNAKALINAERPWVMVQIKEIPGENSAKTNFQFNAFNYGNSPAHVVSCKGPKAEWYVEPDNELPNTPDYGTWEWNKRFLAPRDSFPTREPIEPWRETLKAVTDKAMQGISTPKDSQLVIYGLLEYTDGVSNTTYRTAFCYRRKRDKLSDMGGHLVPCGPAVFNEYT